MSGSADDQLHESGFGYWAEAGQSRPITLEILKAAGTGRYGPARYIVSPAHYESARSFFDVPDDDLGDLWVGT